MRNNVSVKPAAVVGYRYNSPNVPLFAIRRFARQLGERFHPDRIILFGSYAYGRPHAGSDVDLLVVTPAVREVDQAIRMSLAFEPPFPLDLIVRTPAKLQRRLAEGSSFMHEIVTRGKVLYEARDRPVGPQSRSRPRRCIRPGSSRPVTHDLICFHCQQAAEQYLKALLIELGVVFPKTHRLEDLLLLLVPHDPSLKKLRRTVLCLTRYAVDYRYPDEDAAKREAAAAVRQAERVREQIRARLGLPATTTRDYARA
jgi:HEPN domain-containing protein/predicted nucleotidyltransferase